MVPGRGGGSRLSRSGAAYVERRLEALQALEQHACLICSHARVVGFMPTLAASERPATLARVRCARAAWMEDPALDSLARNMTAAAIFGRTCPDWEPA